MLLTVWLATMVLSLVENSGEKLERALAKGNQRQVVGSVWLGTKMCEKLMLLWQHMEAWPGLEMTTGTWWDLPMLSFQH